MSFAANVARLGVIPDIITSDGLMIVNAGWMIAAEGAPSNPVDGAPFVSPAGFAEISPFRGKI